MREVLGALPTRHEKGIRMPAIVYFVHAQAMGAHDARPSAGTDQQPG